MGQNIVQPKSWRAYIQCLCVWYHFWYVGLLNWQQEFGLNSTHTHTHFNMPLPLPSVSRKTAPDWKLLCQGDRFILFSPSMSIYPCLSWPVPGFTWRVDQPIFGPPRSKEYEKEGKNMQQLHPRASTVKVAAKNEASAKWQEVWAAPSPHFSLEQLIAKKNSLTFRGMHIFAFMLRIEWED